MACPLLWAVTIRRDTNVMSEYKRLNKLQRIQLCRERLTHECRTKRQPIDELTAGCHTGQGRRDHDNTDGSVAIRAFGFRFRLYILLTLYAQSTSTPVFSLPITRPLSLSLSLSFSAVSNSNSNSNRKGRSEEITSRA